MVAEKFVGKGLLTAFAVGVAIVAGGAFKAGAVPMIDRAHDRVQPTLRPGLERIGTLAQGVGCYELYHARTLAVRPSEKANPQAVIRLAGRGAGDDAKGGVVLTREERGKGRIVVNVSAMSFQPFRIEKSGNAALLENIVGWLFREDVTDEMRRDFKDNLFLTEETLRTIAAEDAR